MTSIVVTHETDCSLESSAGVLPEFRLQPAHAQEPAASASVTEHSDGLHGYIGFSHEKLPPGSAFTVGMGFYAAVWPPIDEPLANFQIGLPSSWIIPDNSNDKDQPLAPEGTLARTWRERGPTWSSVFHQRADRSRLG